MRRKKCTRWGKRWQEFHMNLIHPKQRSTPPPPGSSWSWEQKLLFPQGGKLPRLRRYPRGENTFERRNKTNEICHDGFHSEGENRGRAKNTKLGNPLFISNYLHNTGSFCWTPTVQLEIMFHATIHPFIHPPIRQAIYFAHCPQIRAQKGSTRGNKPLGQKLQLVVLQSG